MAVGLLGVIVSCDPVRYFPLNVDKLDTNIIELPIDTDSARMEITYNNLGWRCCVYLHLPDGCEVNEDSLAVSFSVPNFSCGRVEKDVIDKRNKPIPLRCSKIDPSHRLSFALYKTGNADIVEARLNQFLFRFLKNSLPLLEAMHIELAPFAEELNDIFPDTSKQSPVFCIFN